MSFSRRGLTPLQRRITYMPQPATTRVLAVDPQRPDQQAIGQAADLLRKGRLVAFPTETVYGLGANALDERAVARIFEAKGRPTTDPLIVHLAAAADLASIARAIPAIAYELARRFWPGPLTLVLSRQAHVPASVSAGLDTVAVRVPAHPVAHRLIAAAGLPVAAPSANRFTRPSPTSAAHVLSDLGDRIDLLLDGGATTIGVESTVVDLTGPVPAVLRPGGITVEKLRQVTPEIEYMPRYLSEDSAASAPGGMLRHYAPEAQLTLVEGPPDAMRRYMTAQAEQLARVGQRAGILVADEDLGALADIPAIVRSLGPELQLDLVALRLFAAIRELDQAQVDAILVRSFGREGLGLAIWDRLTRAAEGRVVHLSAAAP
jgi:L-threonylcarbamoyladenylate synthase